MRVLNAMYRPKNLLDTIEHDAIVRLFPGMICREAAVIRRMPVLGGKNKFETSLQLIGEWNNFIAARNRQRAAWQKVILKIDNDQRTHFDWHRCSSARAINVDLNSCSELSRPTL